MVDGAGEPLVLEVNTLPGMTELSVLPEAAAAAMNQLLALSVRSTKARERMQRFTEILLEAHRT